MKQRRKKTWFRGGAAVSAALILLLSTGSSLAAPAVFSVHDSNGDGYLDRAEYHVFLASLWEKRAGKTGHLPPPVRFEAIDLDRDGRISEDELLHSLEKRFRQRRWRHGWQ